LDLVLGLVVAQPMAFGQILALELDQAVDQPMAFGQLLALELG
jgi:hypothetical protein